MLLFSCAKNGNESCDETQSNTNSQSYHTYEEPGICCAMQYILYRMPIMFTSLVPWSTGTSMDVKSNGHTPVMTITMVNTLCILISKAAKLSLSTHELPANCDVIAWIRSIWPWLGCFLFLNCQPWLGTYNQGKKLLNRVYHLQWGATER